MTKMIVGLGNPGNKYAHTRHNIGFDVLDLLAKKLAINFTSNKTFLADISNQFVNNEKIILVKPTTFMNESGKSVKPLLAYNGLNVNDLIVIYDDLDLITGKIRLREKGSAGGHNGMKSLISHLNTQDFRRLKIGIGRPNNGMSVIQHVLGKFNKEEEELAKIGILQATDAVIHFIENDDFNQTANQFNG